MTKGRLADVLIMSVVGLGRVIGDWVEPAAGYVRYAPIATKFCSAAHCRDVP